MRVPSARNIAAKLAVLQVVLLATSLMGPALGVVPLPIEEVAAAPAGTGPHPQRHQPVRHGRHHDHACAASAFTLELWFKRAAGE